MRSTTASYHHQNIKEKKNLLLHCQFTFIFPVTIQCVCSLEMAWCLPCYLQLELAADSITLTHLPISHFSH